jgi:hypothetical protein
MTSPEILGGVTGTCESPAASSKAVVTRKFDPLAFSMTPPARAYEVNVMNIIPFSFEKFQIRVIKRDSGESWFVGKDVCEALSIANHNDALGRLDDDERQGVGITDPLGKPWKPCPENSGRVSVAI